MVRVGSRAFMRRHSAFALDSAGIGAPLKRVLGPPDPIQGVWWISSKEETVMVFIWFILIGLVAGWLAGLVVKGGGFGVIGDIVVGVLGALLGGFLFRSLGMSAGGGLLGAIIVATIGAIVLILLLRLVKRA
jgi:uncharacterized membrane protein YeaQ/YmgE (transglycosylase-associated protein family)